MRIAVFHDLPSGGAKRTLFEKVRRLSKKHIINIFVFSTANEEFCDLRPWVNDYRVYPLSGPRLLKSPFGRYNQLSRWFHLQKIKSLSCQIAADIDSGGYDVAWIEPSQWTQAPPILSYIKTPSLYYCHETPRQLYESKKVGSNPNSRQSRLDAVDPLIKLYRHTARKSDWEATRTADTVLVNSRFTKNTVDNVYNIEAEVCYNGVDTDVFHIIDNCPKQNRILSVGALQPLKGFDFLVESLALIPSSQRPPVKIIANSVTPGYREFLENLAKEKSVNLLIEVDLPLEELVCQYNKAALLVYVPYDEPFGLVPLEAMACGAPVLGIAEGGVLETVADGVNGRLLPRDPGQFAVAIQRHLEDPNLGRQLAETGREYVVQNWSWDIAADNMEYYLAQTAAVKLDPAPIPSIKTEKLS